MTTEPHPTHVRTDVLTHRQVIVATERSDRPIHVAAAAAPSDHDEDPFLQGNELNTPHERLALRRRGTAANAEGWLLRVVPNRYPAVLEATASAAEQSDTQPQDQSPLLGIHDVIIECPDHRTQLNQLSEVEVARIVMAWQTRCCQIADGGRFRFVNIFRNEGFNAGASLPHCHSQLLASNLVTSALQSRLTAEHNHQSSNGGSLFQAWLNSELTDGSRIVAETPSFVAVCPFASRLPWQIRLCPSGPGVADFCQLSTADVCELAAMLLSVVDGLKSIANSVAFNITLTMPPLETPSAFPWMLDVLPRPSRFAGFELMTDVDILTVSPEQSAEQYRSAIRWKNPCHPGDVCPDHFAWFAD